MTNKTYSVKNRKCPKGYIIRKSYQTKKGKKVKARCIKNPGKGPGKRKHWITALKAKKTKNMKLVRTKFPTDPKCKKGEILRDGYVKKNKTKKKVTIIAPKCIKNRGLPGKTSDKFKNGGIGPLKKGGLGKFGYHNVKTLRKKERRMALQRASKEIGYLTVWRKLNAIEIYNRNTNTAISKIFKQDKNWINKLRKNNNKF
jgi:hypothetical protein